ncbi:interleukin-17 receptor D-like isoform X2 [Lingula anatina]|nr:interleukin-17 receptor D-like isoform X2 [Lingula anatina]|eukprot:XP_023933624.1 interleukin-17 receptor D-like isoform X2 [Lingula anatina]
MHARYLSGNSIGSLCRIFNIEKTGWIQEDLNNKPTFFFEIWPLPAGDNTVFVEICSLPLPKAGHNRPCADTFVSVPKQLYGTDPNVSVAPSEWTTSIQFRNYSCGGVDVNFVLAPKNYGFKLYEVRLVNIEETKIVDSKEVHTLNERGSVHGVSFNDVPNGKYYIWVQPRDLPQDRQVSGRCVCKNTYDVCMNNCLITETVVPVTIQECPGTTPVEKGTTTVGRRTTTVGRTTPVGSRPSGAVMIASIIIGLSGILFGILVLVVVCSRMNRRRTLKFSSCNQGSEGQDGTNNSSSFETKGQTLKNFSPVDEDNLLTRKKRVLILFSEEHPKHTKVVLNFANFLQAACYCDVILDWWCRREIFSEGKTAWLSKNIEKAECVLVVSSEGAYRRFNAHLQGRSFDSLGNSSPLSDMFMHGLSMLRQRYFTEHNYSKYINVRFTYTPVAFSLPDMHNNVVLMDHIDDLFFHIHGIEKYDHGVKRTAERINRDDYFTDPMGNPEGVNLHNAIREATDFFNDHKDWFNDQEFELKPPRSVERYCRLDSGLASLSTGEGEDSPALSLSLSDNIEGDDAFVSVQENMSSSRRNPKTTPNEQSSCDRDQRPLVDSAAKTYNTPNYTSINNVSFPVSIPFHSLHDGCNPCVDKQKARPHVTIPCQHPPKLIPPDLSLTANISPDPPIMFIPPVFDDNQSKTFSQIANDINAECEDDFLTYAGTDENEMIGEETNDEDCISVQSIGGASV